MTLFARLTRRDRPAPGSGMTTALPCHAGAGATTRMWHTAWLTAACVLLLAPAAHAQQVTLLGIEKSSDGDYSPSNEFLGAFGNEFSSTATSRIVNVDECEKIGLASDPLVDIKWNWTNPPAIENPRYVIKLEPPGASCTESIATESDGDGCFLEEESDSYPNLLGEQRTTEVRLTNLLGALDCDSGITDIARFIFVVNAVPATSGVGGDDVNERATSLSFTIDLAAPLPPENVAITGGDQNLKVSWDEIEEEDATYRVYWSTSLLDPNDPGALASGSALVSGSNHQIDDLSNDTTYYVVVTAIDENGNEGAGADVVQGSPVEIDDLWEHYKKSGGASNGGFGCSAAGPGASSSAALPLSLLLLGLVWWLRRRRTGGSLRVRALPVLVAAVAMLGVLASPRAEAASPRTASIAVLTGPYVPMIDREFDSTTGATPFNDIIGESGWTWGVAIDWILLDGIGELSSGFSVSWLGDTGKGLLSDGSKGSDKVSMRVVPVTMDLIYRYTDLAEKYRFALVPYGKLGLAYGFWGMYDGTGEVSSHTDADGKTTDARGGVWGWNGVVGLRLLLDVFEPKAAKSFDIELGVNHSYLFVEHRWLNLTNFGSKDALDLSDNQLLFGIAFDI